jgi:SAM-dependent methyltransferase
MSLLQHRIRKNGVRRALSLTASKVLGVASDYLFDALRGTNTRGREALEGLAISSPNASRGVQYQPSDRRSFFHLMRVLSLPLDAGFVDVGSGKGKVLLMAMEFGFTRVVGIEFSGELCAIARRNVEICRTRAHPGCRVDIVECDALGYEVTADDRIFYLFNPFDDRVLSGFVDRLAESLARFPRTIWILYCHPTWCRVLEDHPKFIQTHSIAFGGSQFFVYSNPPS